MSFIPMRVSVGAPPVVGSSISGGGASGRVAYFDSPTSLTGSANFTFDGTTVTTTSDLRVSSSNSGALNRMYVYNGSNTGGSDAGSVMQVGGTSSGDAYSQYSVFGVTDWTVGLDNSDSDRFKIHYGTGFGTNDYFAIRADGKVYIGQDTGSQTHNIQGDGLSLRRSATGVVFDISNSTSAGGISINGDTGISAGACIQLYGSTSGNPSYTLFRNANVQSGSILDTGVWSIGPNAGGVTHRFNTNTQTTVGAAGVASALPTNPTGYWLLNINGTVRAIPYYANA